MIVYSNHMGMPYNLNIFYDWDKEYPFTLETINFLRGFKTLDALLSCLARESIVISTYESKMIETKIKTAISGCPHYPGRKCRGCSYSSDPDLYDGFCLYGHEDALKEKKGGKDNE